MSDSLHVSINRQCLHLCVCVCARYIDPDHSSNFLHINSLAHKVILFTQSVSDDTAVCLLRLNETEIQRNLLITILLFGFSPAIVRKSNHYVWSPETVQLSLSTVRLCDCRIKQPDAYFYVIQFKCKENKTKTKTNAVFPLQQFYWLDSGSSRRRCTGGCELDLPGATF